MNYTFEYWQKEYVAFRKIMCSTEYTLEQKSAALRGLITVRIHVERATDKQNETMDNIMEALMYEYDKRLQYQIFGF